MGEVVGFEQSRPVMRRRMEQEYIRLMRLHDAFWLTGDSLHARADDICTAAGFRFNVHRPPAGAPAEVHLLVEKGDRYCDRARSFYYRAERLERLLYPARYAFKPNPKGAA